MIQEFAREEQRASQDWLSTKPAAGLDTVSKALGTPGHTTLSRTRHFSLSLGGYERLYVLNSMRRESE